ncbi:MAG: 4-alpha-glucanotransferase [Thermoleophilia bacterium]|jgi:4-alpha-glucanotransferase|nr:4-alpha-glucanotransferase [Thermoleophilia bacterium]
MLLHVTSLPGPDGIGDLGAPARDFVTWLARAGQRLWQTLPLHPPANEVMSPYDAASAFAGNPLLISLDDLAEIGLLPDTVPDVRRSHGVRPGVPPELPLAGHAGGADPLGAVARWKLPLVQQAARQLLKLPAGHELMRGFLTFCEREAWWLADYVAFTALREEHAGLHRRDWGLDDRIRRLGAHRARTLRLGATHQHTEAAVQFLFDLQLRKLREFAGAHDVWLMGDAPIYVGEDSADVWAHPELFLLDDEARPKVLTGAPPDAMDPAGQVWPMPAYDWAANADSGYEWWLRRLRHEFEYADVVRLDHFRAFADWWSVPVRAGFGEQGHWEPGPGTAFFDAVKTTLGELEFVVEDLGMDTKPLQQLREDTGLTLMRVLVQGFDEGGSSMHLPTAWTGNEAAYTDTHDFDTIRGWAERAAHAASIDDSDTRLAFALRFTGAAEIHDLPRASIETVLRSQARYTVFPLQDWLGLGSEARMNVPGTAAGNWRWIAPAAAFTDELAQELAVAATRSGRGAAT